MAIESIKKNLLALRTRQVLQLEEMDKLLKEIESLSPSGEPKKRRNLKTLRKIEAENYLINKRFLHQNPITNKTFGK
ncbi:MAG: hypothetical protein PHW73_01130 [Atribacterota bacterium]|nr:hypothetical protein [Atribacterota bacterium]